MSSPSAAKKAVFWAITMLVPMIGLVGVVQIYFLYGFLSYSVDYCDSFAEIDSEIGWVLAPNAESCIQGRAGSSGPYVFSADVTTTPTGGRTVPQAAETESPQVLVVGDSWSFGYGIEDDETFASVLSTKHGRPTALYASPAYSGAQALVLAQRAVQTVQPKVIVYLELGFWERGVCTGSTRPSWILKPCYWVGPDGRADLVLPQDGFVEAAASIGYLPGGMVGAGEKTLTYFLVARPLSKLNQLMVRLGVMSGFPDDFFARAPEAELAAMKEAHFRNLTALAQRAGATLLLIDPGEVYKSAHAAAALEGAVPVRYIGKETWQQEVMSRVNALSQDDAFVPHDGHFGAGAHAAIAEFLDRKIAKFKRP